MPSRIILCTIISSGLSVFGLHFCIRTFIRDAAFQPPCASSSLILPSYSLFWTLIRESRLDHDSAQSGLYTVRARAGVLEFLFIIAKGHACPKT
jgi:hypothetical protein